MPISSARALRRPGRDAAASAPPSAGAERPFPLVGALSQLLGSHAVLGVAGLASLPVLARNLGPGSYGSFSLFVTVLGVLTQVDFSRPLLVREVSTRRDGTATVPLRSLAGSSAWSLCLLGLAAGWIVLGPLCGAVLAGAAFLQAAASVPYAELAARGRVGVAGAVRNGSWTAALAATVAVSFFTSGPHAWVWSFAGANLLVLAVYRRLAGSRGAAVPRPDIAALSSYRRQSADLVGFGLANAAVASADKLILARTAPAETLGHYVAQYDLAVKINILSTALGHVLYPALARMHGELGHEAAARRFVRWSSWIAVGYFGLLLSLILAGERIVALVLGSGFAGAFDAYHVLLVGVFLHLFGFLITPWQRACGDFATHRRAYFLSAGLMLGVGLCLIPTLGALGAVLAYLSARSAELLLVAVEVRRLPRSILPRWRVAVLGVMVLVLAIASAREILTAGGAA